MIVPANQYYLKRQASHDYSDYWGVREDPDGNLRDRTSDEERVQYLFDVEAEITFVEGLSGSNVCDVGCGPGWFLSALTERWNLWGTELSELARMKAIENGIVLVQLEDCGDMFDVVRCHHVIEHMPQPITELLRMHAALRSGGHLLLSTPDFGGPAAERFGNDYRMLHDPTHCSLFTNESCHRLLRDHGFTIQKVTYPFPRRYMTLETMQRWADGYSPPWPGNWMTFYATKD